MSKIHSLISEELLEEELLTGLKKRNIDQKFEYMEEWALLYYANLEEDKDDWFFLDESSNTFHHPVKKKDKSKSAHDLSAVCANFMANRSYRNYWASLISLGCGNGHQEKMLLKFLDKIHPETVYYGVDSSRKMLEMATENLKDIKL